MTHSTSSARHAHPVVLVPSNPDSSSNRGSGGILSALVAAIVGVASLIFLPWQAACLTGGAAYLLGRLFCSCGRDSTPSTSLRTQSLLQSLVSSWNSTPSSPRRVAIVTSTAAHHVSHRAYHHQVDDQQRRVRFASPVTNRPVVGGGHEAYGVAAGPGSEIRATVGGRRFR